MEQEQLEALKYPLGKFKKPEHLNADNIAGYVKIISEFPGQIKEVTQKLDSAQLNYLHRPGGWSVRQLVHHCADSHLNAFIRIKLTLTETKPTVKPYMENEWVKLADSTEAPIEWSLMILEGVHNRWTLLMNSIEHEDLQKEYFHPEYQRLVKIEELIPLYSWHGTHHLAHITQALKYKNNF